MSQTATAPKADARSQRRPPRSVPPAASKSGLLLAGGLLLQMTGIVLVHCSKSAKPA